MVLTKKVIATMLTVVMVFTMSVMSRAAPGPGSPDKSNIYGAIGLSPFVPPLDVDTMIYVYYDAAVQWSVVDGLLGNEVVSGDVFRIGCYSDEDLTYHGLPASANPAHPVNVWITGFELADRAARSPAVNDYLTLNIVSGYAASRQWCEDQRAMHPMTDPEFDLFLASHMDSAVAQNPGAATDPGSNDLTIRNITHRPGADFGKTWDQEVKLTADVSGMGLQPGSEITYVFTGLWGGTMPSLDDAFKPRYKMYLHFALAE